MLSSFIHNQGLGRISLPIEVTLFKKYCFITLIAHCPLCFRIQISLKLHKTLLPCFYPDWCALNLICVLPVSNKSYNQLCLYCNAWDIHELLKFAFIYDPISSLRGSFVNIAQLSSFLSYMRVPIFLGFDGFSFFEKDYHPQLEVYLLCNGQVK